MNLREILNRITLYHKVIVLSVSVVIAFGLMIFISYLINIHCTEVQCAYREYNQEPDKCSVWTYGKPRCFIDEKCPKDPVGNCFIVNGGDCPSFSCSNGFYIFLLIVDLLILLIGVFSLIVRLRTIRNNRNYQEL